MSAGSLLSQGLAAALPAIMEVGHLGVAAQWAGACRRTGAGQGGCMVALLQAVGCYTVRLQAVGCYTVRLQAVVVSYT